MTQLINTTTKQVITESEFRQLFKDTSFGSVINYSEFGYEVVFPTPQPTFDPITQSVRELPPSISSKGNYEQQWEIIDLDAETIAANQAQHKETNNARIWANIASIERENLLPRCLRDLIPEGHPAKAKVDAVNAEIAALKAELL